MTAAELKQSFKVKIDQTDSNHTRQYEDEEINLWLNEGQLRFIKTRFEGSNPKGESFEQTQKRIEDLRLVLLRKSITPVLADISVHEYSIDLPGDYFLRTNSNTISTCGTLETPITTTPSTRAENVVIFHNDFEKALKDSFKKPRFNKHLILFEGNKVYIYANTGFFPSKFTIIYIKKPKEIDVVGGVSSELAELVHNEIVNEAVSMALENVQSPRYQSNLNELTKEE